VSQRVTVAFASCLQDHVAPFLEKFAQIAPGVDMLVVSEFPPPRGRWIPYRIDRPASENLAAVRGAISGREIQFVAVSLQPKSPYGAMRRLAFRLAPKRTLLYNENLDHYTLHPRSWPALADYLFWKTREYVTWQIHPGGDLYTFLWRVKHPREFGRPLAYLEAKRAGIAAVRRKRSLPARPVPSVTADLPAGISVVIPTRNGREMLAGLLPTLEEMLRGRPSEIILVDNGSDDGTADYVGKAHPACRIHVQPEPMTFARAVNQGIAMAAFSHVLLLNNDMRPKAGFIDPLVDAFTQVPDLFCATAQIFFPEGKRREETGKAVMLSRPERSHFPVECGEPLEGEDGSYVFYGSGGCSLYDTARLKALGLFGEMFQPTYVEDLDIGFRAWQRGWPTVFVARSHVIHDHRSTTSRYYTPEQLEQIIERNYLRFLSRSVSNPDVFHRLWRLAIDRLNWKAAIEKHVPSLGALQEAKDAIRYIESAPAVDEELILAIGSGDVAVFPGRAERKPDVVLVATAYSPFPLSHGGAVRMYNLMRRAARDVSQVLVTFVDDLHTPAPELLDICVEIVQVRRVGSHVKPDRGRPDVVEEFDTPAFRAALHQTMRKWKPGIAQMEFTQMALYSPDCAPAKTILVEHDVTIDLYRQLLETRNDWELRRQLDRWIEFETRAWNTVDRVVVMSDKDRAAITGSKGAVTLANGVDLERFRPTCVEPDRGRLLFIGSFAHLPNLLAIDFFLREVWPLLGTHKPELHIIAGGRHRFHYERFRDRLSFSLDTPGVLIDDFVADVRPAYERAAVVIAPLLVSAGTNIKIMEAMAMGKAIISTTGGVNGLDLRSGYDVIVENDPERMADEIAALLEDPDRRRELGRQARATVEERFNWDRIAATQRQMYQDLLRS
jgi:glycosyltransferase involved in cell wall biosynthesis/GT2 family glycosyltransferase